jgi:hypothetical protein
VLNYSSYSYLGVTDDCCYDLRNDRRIKSKEQEQTIPNYTDLCLKTVNYRRGYIAKGNRLVDERCPFCRANMGEGQAGIQVSFHSESETFGQR